MVKIKADNEKINEKATKIAWIGIDEQGDEAATRRFDQEIIKEAVYTSGDQELISEFNEGRISWHRHPAGKPRGKGVRRRIIKIALTSQYFKDKLLAHMRSGRQTLTRNFVHSFARRDYTAEELKFDQIIKLKAPRDLPIRHLPSPPADILKNKKNNSSSQERLLTQVSGSYNSNITGQVEQGMSQASFSQYSPVTSPNVL
ncbi:hypothetical protein ANCDUO_25308 [Ancylostoma duodenale]|uniref:Uncharacterized protein n=1 Tax=Ancylostoma duodenale TaxID=51022 RepID=A0A0C2FI90_9BILA|nr:hypothetical protein ANCDUO_25308 [Ancylostoma duodenale]